MSVETGASIDAFAMIQDRLGVDPTQAEDFLNIRLVCPMPSKENEQASLGDFLTSERGAPMAELFIGGAARAKEEGLDAEAALASTIGSFAMRDPETNSMLRVAEESKKKYT